jgi:hypothetical protein
MVTPDSVIETRTDHNRASTTGDGQLLELKYFEADGKTLVRTEQLKLPAIPFAKEGPKRRHRQF